MLKRALLAVCLILPAPALAGEPSLQARVEAELAAKAPAGTRFGLLVLDEAGREIVAINPDARFIPASNTKLFTTAAAYAALPGMNLPDTTSGTQVALAPAGGKGAGSAPDVWLVGRGDARMSSAPGCVADCLAALADAISAKTRRVHDIIGDDSFWPDQRWFPGMSWNNIGTRDGAAAGALNLDDNALPVEVRPGPVGRPPQVMAAGYFTLRNEAVTIPAGGKLSLAIERPPGSMELRIYGEIPADAKLWRTLIGIDDPAHYAAWTLKGMLAARGVWITGQIRVKHRAVGLSDDPARQGMPPPLPLAPEAAPPVLARLVPPPLAQDVLATNKQSLNLHADVLLRRLGNVEGTGSQGWGLRALQAALEHAGLPRTGYDFADGAGMSTYNRVSPRAVVMLLRWGAAQPWGAAWLDSLPVGGVDGTLQRRFAGTPLQGNIRAKTGSLNAANALSGIIRTASGRQFTFSLLANDAVGGASALPAMDAALLLIAAAN